VSVSGALRYASDYGVTLVRIDESNIEFVRQLRNDPEINQFMEAREHITAEMQLRWFLRMNNANNYIFVVEHQGRQIGVADAKNIAWDERWCEGGNFYCKEYWNTILPLQGSFTCIDFIFNELRLDCIRSRILMTNARAIRFNIGLGYVLEPGQEGVRNQWYRLTRAGFEQRTARLRKTLASISRET
jgi:RimJ/RimL family protein N-acetyltransferase